MGPGTGMSPSSIQLLKKLIEILNATVSPGCRCLKHFGSVLINVSLPPDSILTPHPGEFKRLADESDLETKKATRIRTKK